MTSRNRLAVQPGAGARIASISLSFAASGTQAVAAAAFCRTCSGCRPGDDAREVRLGQEPAEGDLEHGRAALVAEGLQAVERRPVDLVEDSASDGTGELERLRDAVPAGYTAALDNVGGQAIRTALALGIPASRVNTIADHAAVEELGVQGVGGGKKTSEELAEFARQAAAGELVLPIRSTYHLPDVVAAYRDLETGHGLGKVVLLVP